MNFDYYKQYKDYPNVELLKITRRPGDYMPEAVSIAKQILSERQVTPEEIKSVDDYFGDMEASIKSRKDKIIYYKNKAADFLEPVILPGEKVEPQKWLNILLLVIAIQYGWTFFKTAKQIIYFLKCRYCDPDIVEFGADILTLFYIPLIFYLLFKRKRWGWILLFGDNLFSLILQLSQFYIFFKYQGIHHGSTASFLFPVFIRAAFVFFLWRDSITSHFNVAHSTKKKTTLVVTIGALLFILMLHVMFPS